MDKRMISVSDLNLPNLSADATVEEVCEALKDLRAKAERSSALEQELAELKASFCKERVKIIVERGMAEHRLTKELADKLSVDYASNPEGLQMLVDAMPTQQRVVDKLSDNIPEKYKGKTFRELYVSGEWEEVKTKYPAYAEALKL